MNYKRSLRSVALSALLLSAVSGSVMASAAEDTIQVDQTTITAVQAIPAIATNPLELAKQYAPETVKEWTEVLAKFDKLMGAGDNRFLDITIAEASPLTSLPLLPSGSVLTESAQRVTIPLKGVAQALPLDVKGAIKVGGAVKSTLVTRAAGKAISIGKLAEAELPAITASFVTLANTDPVLESFFKVQSDLMDAVISKDAAAIKTTLANLLVEYKQQITSLEAKK
ncbi:hypothetical protein [Paenibacillus sp. sgz500958]|uniref:hypothetical protein n=1 Tax=Paenibacillus sp. sgz500958 TaxID=3242475 RepID=UPI0036D2173C